MHTRRFVQSGLAGALTVALAACGGGETTNAPAAQSTIATPATAAQAPAGTPSLVTTSTIPAAPTPAATTATAPAATATAPAATTTPAAAKATIPTPVAQAATATPATNAPASAGTGDVRGEVARAFAQAQMTEGYRMEGTVTAADGTTQEISAIFDPPNRVAFMMADGEFRLIDDVIYVKDESGQWYGMKGRSNAFGQQSEDFFLPNKEEERLQAAENFERVGTETVNGVPTTVYRYTTTQNGQQETLTVWVGQPEGLVRKAVSESADGATSTIFFTDYGEAPEVTAPENAEILDLSQMGQPGQNLPGGTMPGSPPQGVPIPGR